MVHLTGAAAIMGVAYVGQTTKREDVCRGPISDIVPDRDNAND